MTLTISPKILFPFDISHSASVQIRLENYHLTSSRHSTTFNMQSSRAYINSIIVQPYKNVGSCIFTKLPPELILSISDFLPYEDLVCFSVCNHRLFNLLRGQTERLFHTRDDIMSFINHLEQDLPGYFACDICLVVHQFEELRNLDREGFPRLCCTARWLEYPMVMKSHRYMNYVPSFSFIQVKLAMKRLYQGPEYGIGTDFLEYAQVRHCSANSDSRGYPDFTVRNPDFILLFSRELAVCHEPLGLYMRTQDIVVFRRKWDDLFLHSDDSTCPLTILRLCCVSLCHIVAPLLGCLYKKDQLSFSISFPYTCSTCKSDAEIEICEFDFKLTIIMTRWMNLGRGITKEDSLWQIHVNSRGGNPPNRGSFIKLNQGPRKCFEKTVSFSFKKLRARNLFHLKDQQYKSTMEFVATRNIWVFPYLVPLIRGQIKRPKALVIHFLRAMIYYGIGFLVSIQLDIDGSSFPTRLRWPGVKLLLDLLFKPSP